MVAGLDYQLSSPLPEQSLKISLVSVFLVPSCWPMGKSAAEMRKDMGERKNKKRRVRVC